MPENATPDTLSYLLLGLFVIFAYMAGYIATLISRHRNLQKDAALLEQLRDDKA
ncbi:MAG: hypothetical protein OHK0046_32550 [Anaerolineae bacterium]